MYGRYEFDPSLFDEYRNSFIQDDKDMDYTDDDNEVK